VTSCSVMVGYKHSELLVSYHNTWRHNPGVLELTQVVHCLQENAPTTLKLTFHIFPNSQFTIILPFVAT